MSERPVESPKFCTDEIREYAKRIVENHQDILTINYNAISENYLEELKECEKYDFGSFGKEKILTLENELGLNLFLDVVNFCYKDPYGSGEEYHYIRKDGKNHKRTTGLTDALIESGINWGDTEEVSSLTPKFWDKIIQRDNNKNFYLARDRGFRIKSFASQLYDNGIKSASEFLDFCNYDAKEMLINLKDSGFFNDFFLKRAQLAVNMLDQVLGRRTDKRIKNINLLTIMADYRVPQVHYNDGIIKLSDELYEKLMKEIIMHKNSREVLTLRSACIVIGMYTAKILNIPECRVDSLQWKKSIDMARKGFLKIPHMLVPTDEY